jgi:protein SCO1
LFVYFAVAAVHAHLVAVRTTIRSLALALCACCAVPALSDPGERGEPLPSELEGVGITEHLGQTVPSDIVLRDETGREVRLGDYFDGTRPVILNLLYMGCPMLCGLVSSGLNDALKEIDLTVGGEYGVLSVSFDPTETPALATVKRQEFLRAYGRPGAEQGWHVLTGDEANIRRLTDAVGFGFRWNEQRQEFAHAAVLIVLMPDGTVSRYLYGVQYDPRTVKLSLVEAADGKTGSTLDKFLLFCFHYDATTGRYGPAAMNLMKIAGGLTVLLIGGLVLGLRRRERRGAATTLTG